MDYPWNPKSLLYDARRDKKIRYEKPELIIEKIEELEGQILGNIAVLKGMLNENK